MGEKNGANIIKVLLVEDNLGDAFLIEEKLKLDNKSLWFQLTHVERLGEAIARIGAEKIDVILLDLSLPDSQGLETFLRLQEQAESLPIVVLTGMNDEQLAIQAVRQGAQDYLVKNTAIAELLVHAIRYAIERKGTQEELKKRSLQLEAANRELKRRTEQLEALNRELETFSYTVSHDLRNPLQTIDGFSYMLQTIYAEQLEGKGQHYIEMMRQAVGDMGQLIEDLLNLSLAVRSEIEWEEVDLSAMVFDITKSLQMRQPSRQAKFSIAPNIIIQGDENLLRIALENLVGNAWKYTSKEKQTSIEFGVCTVSTCPGKKTHDDRVYFLRDNGVGFDMEGADKLFTPFRRLHQASEFEGTGIGLATVQRILHSHGGRIWAEAAINQGATFYFTIAQYAENLEDESSIEYQTS